MGEVYVAQDTRLDRRVALKILPAEFAADADRMRRFVLEAKSASALNHPNIITIYEVGEIDGTNFIATEYIDGKTLNHCDSLSLVAALDVANQIASSLQAAHSAGIVHRDIKPDNVMIRPDGLVKILDFGIAKLSGVPMIAGGRQKQTDPEAATAVQSHTSTGMIIGTATYMSPEQARGKAIDSRSDLFSFGVVLYEMLSGKRPFVGENAMDVIGSIVADEPKPLKELLPSLPAEIDRIVTKALQKDREKRYQTAGEMLADLKSVHRRLEFEAEFATSSPAKAVEVQTQIVGSHTTIQTGSHNSIAVLPFSNLSADPDNEYFCDGLAEELLGALSKIENLRVAARSSTFSFKGRNVNVSEIGRTLNVGTVLEGSVRKSGDRLRISLQLINAADGYQLWSERYDREMKDIFEVQDEITLAVVDALKLKLLVDEKEEVLKRYTKNAEAYQLYLRGRFLFFKRTHEAFLKAIEYFRQAIELDGEYALAYSGLADSYTFLGFYEHISPAEAVNNLKAPAFKSLELDDTLAETRTSIALYRSLYQWDLIEGDKEHKRAIACNPKYALAHHLDSATVILLGRFDDAIASEGRAIELDPFTAIFNATLGWLLYLSRRNDEAIAQSKRTIEIAPDHLFAHWVLGLAYGRAGRYDESIEALQKAVSITGGAPHIKAELARVLASSGRRDEAHKLLTELIEQAKVEYVSPVNLAKVYVGLNEVERVYEQFEKAVADHSVRLPWFMIDPCVDHLSSQSHFQDLLNRIGVTRRM
jgi:serine/threonine-protein kinase